MIVPINGGGVCASRAIPSVRHICFGVVNSLPPSPSIRSASFGPLHSLSPLGLAIRIHRCSTQTTLTPSFYENKTTTAIAETNKQKRRVRQAIFIHDTFDAPGKFTVRRIRIFPGLKIFFISTEVHNSCFADLRCFFFVRCVSFMPRPIANVVVVRATIHRVFTSMASRCCSCADCNPSLSKRRGYVQF